MQGIWLVSYVILWLFVLLQTALLVALLRHIGNLRLWLREAGVIRDTNGVEEGLLLGESVPDLREFLKLKVEPAIEIEGNKSLLLVFIAPGLPGMDDFIPAVKNLEQIELKDHEIVFISMEPAAEEQFNFIRLSGLQVPIVLKHGWELAMKCQIRSTPYALIFDEENILLSKIPVSDEQSLRKLIKTSSA